MDPNSLTTLLDILVGLASVCITITAVALAPPILRWLRDRDSVYRRRGGRRPQKQPRIIWTIFWVSTIILALAPLGKQRIASMQETIATVDEIDGALSTPGSLIAVTPSIILRANAAEVLLLDTYENNDKKFIGPIRSNIVFENGKTYRLTISGTWSAWEASWWADVCAGTPEIQPQTASPDTINGNVGIDVAYIFARPARSSYCGQKEDLPAPTFAVYPLLISLDGGISWEHLNPDDQRYNPEHIYTYTIRGKGHLAQIQLNSSTHYDDYGILAIQVEGPLQSDGASEADTPTPLPRK
jgi:hypothetical protein